MPQNLNFARKTSISGLWPMGLLVVAEEEEEVGTGLRLEPGRQGTQEAGPCASSSPAGIPAAGRPNWEGSLLS